MKEKDTSLNKTFRFLLDHPACDLLIGGIASIICICLHLWDVIDIHDHASLYSSIIEIILALFGFGSVVTTLIVTVTPNEKYTKVLNYVGNNLIKLMLNCLKFLLLSSLFFILLFTVDACGFEIIRTFFAVMGATFITNNAIRYIWLLEKILIILIEG